MPVMRKGIAPEWVARFRSTMREFAEFADEEWEKAIAQFVHVRIPKDGYFLRAGDVPDKLAFIASGVFRVFFVTEGGDERIHAFRDEGRLISAFSPFLTEKKSWYSIQALEDSDLLCTRIDVGTWTSQAECWRTLYAKYMEKLFVEKENREREFLSDDAETRYRNFRDTYPGLENRIAQYHVASYLGITPVALSRIRKGMQ
jgi:CRP-like cAMP-binding protein